MSMTNVEVLVTLSVPFPSDPAERLEVYGTSDLQECMQIDLENDPAAVLLDSTIINVQVGQ